MFKFWCVTGCVGGGGGEEAIGAFVPQGKDKGLAKMVVNKCIK